MKSLTLALFVLGVAVATNAKTIIKNCDGFEDAALVVVNGTILDEIPISYEITMDLYCKIQQELPDDLHLELDLQWQELHVPCVNGLGSCEYDICSMITDNGDTVCGGFPEGQACGCPLHANDYDLKGVTIQVLDFGILKNLMVESYKATGTFYGQSTPDNKLGCIEFDFTL